MNPHYVTSWKLWKEMSKHYGFDPYEQVDFGIDKGGGNSTNFEYVGNIPKKEEE